jgi:xylulokinase
MSGPPASVDPGAHERFALAVDLGTGGPKVGLVSLTGEIAWHDHVAVTTDRHPDGGATQDADAWWTAVCALARRALAAGVVRPEQVVAVGCTGQWASTVPVDGAGRPVGECVMWMDTRGGRYTKRALGGPVAGYAPRPLVTWIRRSGGAPSPTGADPVGHMLWLQHERPEVARAARWFMEPVDYLAMRFTGVAAASHASMTAAWLTDNRNLARLEYDPVLVRLSGVDATKLPPLRPTGSVVGTVRPEVADEIGLPPDVAVVTGVPDLHSATVGAGTTGDFEVHLAVSTTSWIGGPVPFKRTDAIRNIASVPGIRPDRYLIANNHETGGLALEWARSALFGDGDGRPSFDDLTALADSAPPGSGRVVFTPWLQGERSPVSDPRARAGFHNLSLGTGRAELVRAVLEGVAYNNRWLHEAVERFARRRLDPVRIIGGGAISDLWCRIHADVMGRTVERVAAPREASLRGTGLLAGIALGAVGYDAVRALVPVDAVFTPDPATRATYDALFAELPRLWRAEKPMFARLSRSVP